MDLALNNLQRLICHKPKQPTNQSKNYSKVKLATIVEGDQKAPLSIATTPRCRGGHYSFPWIAPLYPSYVSYISEC